jgi:hypothetical protein
LWMIIYTGALFGTNLIMPSNKKKIHSTAICQFKYITLKSE